ncbi:hypothetical protein WG66_006514 [Moniliophthora roreri]|nr:hypothetical protein WG66_006514 [Moniliophthora roreri]
MASSFPFKSLYSIRGVLLVPFVSVGLMLFLLGFYILLYGLAVYFFCVRQTRVKRRLHLWWMTTLFVLSFSSASLKAGQIIHNAILGFQAATTRDFDPPLDWMTTNGANIVLETVSAILYVLANCITDMILLYRCFVLWDSRRHFHIVAILVILFLTNVVGFIGAMMRGIGDATNQSTTVRDIWTKMSSGYVIVNAINGLLLTFIIAGRIWRASRQLQKVMGHEVDGRYKRIVAMVVKSGFLYSASLIVYVSVKESSSNLGFGLDLFPVVALMVGIAPTLIILRSSLGLESAVPDSRMISTLRFGEPPAAAQTGQHSEVRTVDLQQGSVGSSDDLEMEACKAECRDYEQSVIDSGTKITAGATTRLSPVYLSISFDSDIHRKCRSDMHI